MRIQELCIIVQIYLSVTTTKFPTFTSFLIYNAHM